MVQLGELSSGRQALEGAALALGTTATHNALRDPQKRPPRPREAIPEIPPHRPFELDEVTFCRNLRSAKRGAAGGPSGMTWEHLRPLLESPSDTNLLYRVASLLAQKSNGGVRGIMVGEVIRRLVARTIAQQLGPAVEAATSPFQFALSTKSGSECVAHCIQALCETDEQLTLTSVDGVSAFDLISRRAMMAGLESVDGGVSALPFVHLFYGRPSSYLWEDDSGTVHTINQGEGGEQGDPLMPLLFSVGQHPALLATQERLEANEWIFAFLDDIYILTKPERVGAVYAVLQEELFRHAYIRINGGKTHVWNAAGIEPPVCAALQRIAEVSDTSARVWRGSDIPPDRQGIRVLGAPVGHPEFVRAQMEMKQAEHQVLLDRIPALPDLQSAWALLVHCAASRANYFLRVVPPELGEEFASAHDRSLWTCLCNMMGIAEDACEATAREAASLPLALGGVGLRSARRTHPSAYWASWADSLHMVQKRHPGVEEVEGVPVGQSLTSASAAARSLADVHGFDIPSWRSLAAGVRPPPRDPEDHEPGSSRQGWQHEASSRVEQQFRALDLFPRITDTEKTMLRSQSGPGAGAFLSSTPSNPLTRIDSSSFRTLLCRRLRLAIPLSTRICRCGRTIDHFGHHRAACARSGVLARRGFAVESAVARICREGGGRVATNRMIRDLDLAVPNPGDLRRIEVIVDGLGIFGGAQLAVDATMVSPVRADGLPRPGAAAHDGVALTTARLRKQRTYNEL